MTDDYPMTDEALTELLQDVMTQSSLRTQDCPSPAKFASPKRNWTAEEATHIESCPRCQSKIRAADRVFGAVPPVVARNASSLVKPFFFAAVAAKDSFSDPLAVERAEVFGGVEFTVKTRMNHYKQFVYGACTTQREIAKARVVIRSYPTNETGATLVIAESDIEFIEFSPGKWCGDSKFDMKMLEDRLNGCPFTAELILESPIE